MNAAIKEQIFDIVLKEALRESMEREFKEIDEMVIDEPHEFSPQFEKKMKKLINSIGRKDRIKKYKRIAVRTIVSVAAAFGLIFGGLLTQPEVFASVQNVFRSVFDTHDRYEYVGEELTTENFDNNIRLGYVPDGYYLSEGYYSPVAVTLVYTNKLNEITFEYGIAESSVSSYDNENNSYVSFYSNGIEYYYYESSDTDFDDKVIWYERGYKFGIYAHLSKDELVNIAENIKK